MTVRAFALVLAALTAAAVYAGFAFRTPSLLEAWLLAFIVLTGFAAASLGLLMIGHLLGDVWLAPIRDELEPASWTVPVIALLALPLAAGIEQLYPWTAGDAALALPPARRAWFARDWFLLRAAIYLAVWSVLAVVIARAGPHRAASGVGLALLGATYSLASVDWIMSREIYWWSSLFGFALAVSQLLAALAAAILVTVARQGHPEPSHLDSLEKALLTLALLTGWVWFSQFLVVWMANLPGEARWYLARDGEWGSLQLAVIVPSLALAILLLIPTRARRWRMLAACGLVLVHHIAHMAWLIGPAAIAPLGRTGLAVLAGLVALWAGWFALALWQHGRAASAQSADQGRAAPSAGSAGAGGRPGGATRSSAGSGG